MTYPSVITVIILLFAPTLGLAQSRPPKPPKALNTLALSGEAIAVLPLTLAAADPALTRDSVYAGLRNRREVLRWADSVIGEELQARAPEITWVLPPRIRQIARRNPGMLSEPDQMGQAILRSPKLKRVPEPLRTNLRSLTSFTGGRFAMVPAALVFVRDTSGALRADLTIALADTRTGAVEWHALTWAMGASPDEALSAAVAAVLPLAQNP
ncbi:MAG TPA: hypothetical protein VFM14_11285 [Gemmatimonadales bacterium]|nr:hypothetical protein [Gemmatimonadales bacterium]